MNTQEFAICGCQLMDITCVICSNKIYYLHTQYKCYYPMTIASNYYYRRTKCSPENGNPTESESYLECPKILQLQGAKGICGRCKIESMQQLSCNKIELLQNILELKV